MEYSCPNVRYKVNRRLLMHVTSSAENKVETIVLERGVTTISHTCLIMQTCKSNTSAEVIYTLENPILLIWVRRYLT